MAQPTGGGGILKDILESSTANRVVNHLRKVRSTDMLFGVKHFESDIVKVERDELMCGGLCTDSGKRGVVYELSCIDSSIPGEPRWSVWKTAEEFADLDSRIRRTYPHLLKRTPFPSKSLPNMLMSLVGLGGFAGEDPSFTARLKTYWREVMAHDELTDFANDRCSVLVKNFVQMDANVEEFLDHAVEHACALQGEQRYYEDDGHTGFYLDDDTSETGSYADTDFVRKLSYDDGPFA